MSLFFYGSLFSAADKQLPLIESHLSF